ncbi:MAG TPA: ribosomal large subunit pseudouridine synthase B [Succinivibrionaceae bacterium]|nr:ribosomal large subunit pseudouridine synthase B [Succinivibrionaceae bacterium]
MSEKLQKVLARLGLGSRRGLEELIASGRVSVNGVKASLGDRIEDDVTVTLDGKVVMRPGQAKIACRVLMYHKPEGELTTLKDPEDRPTVFDHLPKAENGRWIYIGRLDINTSGLLLFTTDGELANALMHPRHGIERIYAARVYGDVTEEAVEKLQHEVKLEDGPAHFDKVKYVGGDGRNLWFHCTLKEGRKREVRRLWEAVGCKVSRLIRISYGGIALDPRLKTGEFRDLSVKEINRLRLLAGADELAESEIEKTEDNNAKVQSVADPRQHKRESLKGKVPNKGNGYQNANSFSKRRHAKERQFDEDVFVKDQRFGRGGMKNTATFKSAHKSGSKKRPSFFKKGNTNR